MRKLPILTRADASIALNDAIFTHRQARISLAISPSPGAVRAVMLAFRAERRARRRYKPHAIEDRAARRRPGRQRTTRTTIAAVALRADRIQRRGAAALAAAAKRVANYPIAK